MTEPDDHRPTRSAVALLVVGALLWPPTRYGVMTSWDDEWLGLGYTSWNRLSLVPIALLAAGSAAALRLAPPRRAARAGWAVVAAGFAMSLVGVVLEFVVGGGLQGGPEGLAVAGWTAYLLGYAITAVGLLVLAFATARHDRPAAVAAGLGAGALLGWPLLIAAGQDALAVVAALLVPLSWLVLAARLHRLPSRERVAAPAR